MSTTRDNLEAAFVRESTTAGRYTYFAKIAKKEGYHYIAKIFEEAAANERRHAKDLLAQLDGIGDTVANLKEAIEGEHYEVTRMYPEFAQQAEAEGDADAARLFSQIARVEREHEARYRTLLRMVEDGTVYRRDTPIRWKCSVCGLIHEGTEPPRKCPACLHAAEYFEPDVSLT
jgi:rubrerythrin